MHGSDQLNAHAEAARKLSAAKNKLIRTTGLYAAVQGASVQDVEDAERALAAAKAELHVAYQMYTNPFGIEKTV